MRLYLVQHGEARPETEDPERRLSDKGLADAEKTAAFLRPLSLELEAIWQSGKARAAETAEILARVVKSRQGTVQRSGIAPLDPVDPIAREVTRLDGNLMIVGHLPFMNRLASALAAGSDSADCVAFQQAGVTCLERDDKAKWRVRWMVTPDLLP